MNVEELLDMLEETLEEGTAVPFAAVNVAVDVDSERFYRLLRTNLLEN